MQSNPMIKIFSLLLLCIAILSAANASAQKQTKKSDPPLTEEQLYQLHAKAKVKPPSGAWFYIAPIVETPGRFSITFSDNEGRTISGVYVRSQIDILEALLTEAKKFALTDEAIGLKKPVVTRLKDKSELSFFIDVAKVGLQSQFFITFMSMEQVITVNAGTIKRGDEKAKALLYEVLKRVQDAKTTGQVSQ